MSVPNDTCTECCTCPTAIVEWDSRSASKTKCGYDEFTDFSTPPKRYLKLSVLPNTGVIEEYFANQPCSGSPCDYEGSAGNYTSITYSASGYRQLSLPDCEVSVMTNLSIRTVNFCGIPSVSETYDDWVYFSQPLQSGFVATYTKTTITYTGIGCGYNQYVKYSGSVTQELSEEFTTDQLKSITLGSFPAYDNDWSDTAGSFANLSTDELTYTVRQSRYRFRFKVPRANSRSYRLSWVERFIPQAGTSLSSIEVISGGVYRPGIGVSAPLAGGQSAIAVAVMTSTGGVSSIRVLGLGDTNAPAITFSGGGGSGAAATAYLNSSGQVESVVVTSGGSGYTSAPTVAFSGVLTSTSQIRATGTAVVTGGRVTSITMSNVGNYLPIISVQAATSGGTSSTGWVASLTDGKLSSISGGSEGNYLPTLAISAPGGTGTTATATCTMDETGGIASVSVTSGGSKYTSEPTITVTAKAPSTPPTVITPASLLLHMGTETTRCDVWDKTTLADKWFTREVADGGHPLTSIEVIHGGHDFHTAPTIYVTPPSYLNTTVSAPPSGGTQAVIRANLNSSGRVTGFTIVQAGSGYTSAPTITLPNPGAGNTQATGWVTTINGSGAVTAVTGGTQGDYAVAATANVSGKKITSISITKYGWGFTTNPVIQVSGGGSVATVLLAAHFGTEVEYADGTQPPTALPVGYVASQTQTYPLLGESGSHPWKYYNLAVPGSNGTTLVANVRAICDGSSC